MFINQTCIIIKQILRYLVDLMKLDFGGFWDKKVLFLDNYIEMISTK